LYLRPKLYKNAKMPILLTFNSIQLPTATKYDFESIQFLLHKTINFAYVNDKSISALSAALPVIKHDDARRMFATFYEADLTLKNIYWLHKNYQLIEYNHLCKLTVNLSMQALNESELQELTHIFAQFLQSLPCKQLEFVLFECVNS